ncbi:hypothetical protein BDD43_3599 [Mucilaginibacter gracilis]|uniref:Immunity protein 17 of polymorphic toxin system n=1 Tax=Mucilaginibacter gracilis TaxID=423350 RepID=A0A495J3Y6_9SPHI|nr:hypothetical protein [Mucilaginibacter gracilis]RKR83391.1 hypothetical protein BDD43_3599 [Mucilaginibacter gracilis]
MMRNTYIAISILLVLDIAVLLLARWFDRRYYVPFLIAMNKQKKEPEYNPYLIRLGLMAAGGGLVVYALVAAIWWQCQR